MKTLMVNLNSPIFILILVMMSFTGRANNTADSTHRVLHFSLIPYLSTNGLESQTTINNLSINTSVGIVGGINGLEIGGVANLVQWNVNGLQIAGATNFVGGNVAGFQCAGAINKSASIKGFQLAGALNIASKHRGGQIAGATNIVQGNAGPLQVAGAANIVYGDYYGFQCAGVTNTSRYLEGIQLSGAVNNSSSFKGAQIAGALNISGENQGVQLAGATNISSNISSLQLAGAVNIADTVKGAQIAGVLNIAMHLKGLQLGVVNYADTSEGIPIGVINIVKRGGVHNIDLYADEVFYTNLAFSSGVKSLYTILLAGIQNPMDFDKPLWTFGWGIGTSKGINKRLQLDIDLRSQHVAKGSDFSSYSVNMLHKLGVGGSWRLARGVSLTMAVTYNLYLTDTRSSLYDNTYSAIPPYHIANHDFKSNNMKAWVGGRVGVMFF